MEELKKLVDEVEMAVVERQAAHEAETAAAVELLARLIDVVGPLVRVVGTRPEIKWHMAHFADVNRGGGEATSQRYECRCLHLAGDADASEDHPRADSGAYEGQGLWLRDDRALVQFTYTGDWSRWQGSNFGYEAEVRVYKDPREAVDDGWTGVEGMVENVTETLESHRDQRAATANKLKRAERLRALATLLS